MTYLKFLILVLLFSCSSVEFVEKSFLNHPAMDLEKDVGGSTDAFLTKLNSFDKVSGGSTCSTCAY